MALEVPLEVLDSEECVALRLPKKHRLRMNRVGRVFDRLVVIVVTAGLGFMLLTVLAAVFLLGRTLMMTTTGDAITAQTAALDTNTTDDAQFDAHRTVMIMNKAKRLLASPISIGFLRHRQRAHRDEKILEDSN
uniref:Uncharacterized protein n=1 Tax=Plectus sambesii TaxID=2011161 RepID=A0A914W0A6_9BILA